MRHMINGREFEVRANADGSVPADDIRRAAGIPSDRALVLKRPDGSNQVINPGEKIYAASGGHFADMPSHRRGEAL